MNSEIEKLILNKIKSNIENLNIRDINITYDMDLIKSGIIDSMDFIELLLEMEKITGTSIRGLLDDESELMITIDWFLKKFNKKIGV
jgi:acyl carrier protein